MLDKIREIIKTDVSIINSPQPIAVVVTNGLIELEMTNIETRIETLNNEIEVLKSMISQINQFVNSFFQKKSATTRKIVKIL